MDIHSYVVSKLGKEPNSSGKIHARCPFHDDRHASFSFDLNKGLFICGSSSCGVRGNFILFFKLIEGIANWKEVYEKLKAPHLAIDMNSLLGLDSYAERAKEKVVNPWPSSAFLEPLNQVEYLASKGISTETINTFGLHYGKGGSFSGVDIENSIVVPVYDVDSTYRTFQVRYLINTELKWKNPMDSPLQDLLYGGWILPEMGSNLWIVEGASDVWNLYEKGVQAVGLFTKEASTPQLSRLHKMCKNWDLQPVVCLDGDTHSQYSDTLLANKDYCIHLHDVLWSYGFEPKVIYLRDDKDPGMLTVEDVSFLQQKLASAETKILMP